MVDRITCTQYQHELDYAPIGHMLLTVSINQFQKDIDYWIELYKNKSEYLKEKERIGQQIIKELFKIS